MLGRYELLTRIAIGGMGEVFLAREHGTAGMRRLVVVKRLIPELAEDPEMVGLFIDEASIVAQLTHPNTVQLYEFGNVGATYFLAMEYVPGASLSRVMSKAAREGLEIERAAVAYAVGQASHGLHFAHEAKDTTGEPLEIIHRDVSPQNILMSRTGDVKVMDFGIARATSRRQRTRTGTVRGKVGYMSPEQVTAKPLDRRSDVFSAGVILFEGTLGRPLFDGASDLAVMRQTSRCIIPVPTAIDPSYPEALEQIVVTALSRDPAGRYATSDALADALDAYVETVGGRRRWQARWAQLVTALFPPLDVPSEEARATPRRTAALPTAAAVSEGSAPNAPAVGEVLNTHEQAVAGTEPSAPKIDDASEPAVGDLDGLADTMPSASSITADSPEASPSELKLGPPTASRRFVAFASAGALLVLALGGAWLLAPTAVVVQSALIDATAEAPEANTMVDAGPAAPAKVATSVIIDASVAPATMNEVTGPAVATATDGGLPPAKARPRRRSPRVRRRARAAPAPTAAIVERPAAPVPVLDEPGVAPRSIRLGRLAVSANPWGEVQIDGEPRGTTDLQVEIEAGEHRVAVAVPGRGTYRATVRVEAEGKTKCRVAQEQLRCSR